MEYEIVISIFTLLFYAEPFIAEEQIHNLRIPQAALENFNYFPPPQPRQNFFWGLPFLSNNPYIRNPGLINGGYSREGNSNRVGQNPSFLLPHPSISSNSPSRSLSSLHMERSGRRNESDFVRADALDLESSITALPIPIHFLKRESGERIQIDTSNKPFHFHIPFISPGLPSRTPSAKEAFAVELSKSIKGSGTHKGKREDERDEMPHPEENNDEEFPRDASRTTTLLKRQEASTKSTSEKNQPNGGLGSNDLNVNFPAIEELDLLKLEKEIKESRVNFYYLGSEKVYLETTPEISQTLVEDMDDFQMALLTLKAQKRGRTKQTTTVRTNKRRKKRDVKEWVDKIKKIFSKPKAKHPGAEREWSKKMFESYIVELEGRDSEIDKLLPLELRTSHFLLGKDMIKNPGLRLAALKYENSHSSSLKTRRRKRSAPVEKMEDERDEKEEERKIEVLLEILLTVRRGEPSFSFPSVHRRLRVFLDQINATANLVEIDILSEESSSDPLPHYSELRSEESGKTITSTLPDDPQSLSFLTRNDIGEGGAIKRTKRLLPLQLPERDTEAVLGEIFSLVQFLLCYSDEKKAEAGSKFLGELMRETRRDVLGSEDENAAELGETIKETIACPGDNHRRTEPERKVLGDSVQLQEV